MDTEPILCRATDFTPDDVGTFAWDETHNADLLTFRDAACVVEWGPQRPGHGRAHPPAWVPIRTTAQLHSGTFHWDFVVEEMASAQLGVGFMLRWDQGLDWGFFGYLGAGATAWSYDPSTGDVVTQTRSIAGGLPVFAVRRRGVVAVRLELPRHAASRGVFVVDGREAPVITLPVGAVVVPAACLLRETQRVRLGPLARS